MNINKYTNKTIPSFGMQFEFKPLSPDGDWFGADREFFNSTYQLGIIHSKVDKLTPKEDKFVLTLDLPETEYCAVEKDNKFYNKSSYKMYVDIFRKEKQVVHHDLSEKDVLLDYFDAKDRFEVHPKGPFNKLLDLLDELKN